MMADQDPDQTDNLTLNEDKLDYEADEGDQGEDARVDTPNSSREEVSSPQLESHADKSVEEDGELSDNDKAEDKNDDLESGEELEDGEISDEDEALKNERNEPKAVCRFYNRGHCTWGTSCRFLHPGVLDKGNYNMFAAPRPILPGEPEKQEVPEVELQPEEVQEPILMRPPAPAYETAWERGLRQAKEMRRRSHKRREMDVEYEEKKSNLSLTQIELDKENDYYTRPASPAHTHDPYADDEYTDSYDNYYPSESRRIAPPPPSDFVAREERAMAVRRGYSNSPPPRTRRVAPPRSPDPTPAAVREEPAQKNRFRGGEDWADPWMRSKDDKAKAGRPRRRSYSSGSSRSSSSKSSSSGSSFRRRRKYSTSPSSRSSSSSRSRSRSSTPEGIPRRTGGPTLPQPVKNTAPLQKRLGVVSQQSSRQPGSRQPGGGGRHPGGKKWAGAHTVHHVNVKVEGESRKGVSMGGTGEQTKVSNKQPRDPVKLNLPKNNSKFALKTASGKPSNIDVLEKLGTKKDELPDFEKRKRKLEQNPDHPESIKQRKLENEELMETLKQRLKTNLEAKQAKESEVKSAKVKKISDVLAIDKKVDKDKKKKALNAAAAAPGGGAAAGAPGDTKAKRKEELLKQLKAVEDAIHRKRTKLDK